MTESVLVTWESQVLGPGHPAIVGSASRSTRHHYVFPNGTEIILGGMDNPDRILSTEYDLVCIFEAAEVSPEDLEKLGTRLRNNRVPWQQLVCDTNPRGEFHWLNVRAERGVMTRLLSRHWMNPAFYDDGVWTEFGRDYLSRVAKGLTGARFLQLFKGKWAANTGLVYPMFEPATHVVKGHTQKDDNDRLWLFLKGQKNPIEISWTVAGVDWGFTLPGCMQVWGVTKDQDTYLLAEIYQAEKSQDWWADRVVEFRKEFGIRRVICDPAEPDRIQVFNDRLGTPGGRPEARIAQKANNAVLTGISHLQALMAPTRPGPDGQLGSKVYLLDNCLRYGRDPVADASGKPCTLKEELTGLLWEENEEGKKLKERPDPSLPDHAENTARYTHMWIWRKDLTPDPIVRPIREGSIADVLGHREKLEALRRRMRE